MRKGARKILKENIIDGNNSLQWVVWIFFDKAIIGSAYPQVLSCGFLLMCF
jgi:hypothetical protein